MLALPSLPRTLAACHRDLDSKDPRVRAGAIVDFARHADDHRASVVEGLEKALKHDAHPDVRGRAATALADIQAKEAVPVLLRAVDDENIHVRELAISALGEIGDPAAAPRVRRALRDEHPQARFQATIAFPRVAANREDAIEALLAAMRDEDPLVIHIALRMAEEISAPPDALRGPWDRGSTRVDGRFLLRAKALLDHENAAVRAASAILLAGAGEAEGRSVLTAVASGALRTDDIEDEAACIELAGALGLTAAEKGLEKRAFRSFLGFGRDRLAWHARVALARMGHARAVREILAELSSWNRERRTLAVAAAGRARIRAAHEKLLTMRDDERQADPSAVEEALASLGGA